MASSSLLKPVWIEQVALQIKDITWTRTSETHGRATLRMESGKSHVIQAVPEAYLRDLQKKIKLRVLYVGEKPTDHIPHKAPSTSTPMPEPTKIEVPSVPPQPLLLEEQEQEIKTQMVALLQHHLSQEAHAISLAQEALKAQMQELIQVRERLGFLVDQASRVMHITLNP
jgi:hypothetical protein